MAVIIEHLASASSVLPTDASALESSISALKSSISALEISVKTIEGSSGLWEIVGWSCAIAVGIGIVGEFVVIVGEYFDELDEWKRGIVWPPNHPNFKRFLLDIVATTLVLVGVFGEAGASMKLGSINSQLRSKTSELRAKSDQLLALVTQEAGSAASSAVIAKDAAGKAKDKADAVDKKADALDKRMYAASSKLGALEGRLAWRRVSHAQYESFKKVLSPFPNAKVFVVIFSNEDEESKTFANDLVHLLHDGAKWEVVPSGVNTVVPLPVGLRCEIDTSTPAGKALAAVMGKFPGAIISPNINPGVVGAIVVGIRLPP